MYRGNAPYEAMAKVEGDDDLIRDCLIAGMKAAEIAKKWDVSPCFMSLYIKENNLRKNPKLEGMTEVPACYFRKEKKVPTEPLGIKRYGVVASVLLPVNTYLEMVDEIRQLKERLGE